MFSKVWRHKTIINACVSFRRSATQWHHVVTTFDGQTQVTYLDGKPDGKPLVWKESGKVGMTDFNLVIGCNRSSLTEPDLGISFRGLIDEPMMWNRALSEKEVAFLFQSQGGSPAVLVVVN